jgi:dimethylhistidine N-methyltransferase
MNASARAAKVEESRESSAFATDVLEGLNAPRKRLAAKYFYDRTGSQLFERITALPEYYPTRTELSILRERAPEFDAYFPDRTALIEFGSGASTKARVVLAATSKIAAYVPVDISSEFLRQQATDLRRDLPNIAVIPVEADFMWPFALPASVAGLPRAGFFPGSTIGNFEPHEACAFLRHAGSVLGADATLIVGVDLVKDRAVLNAAYNDSAGVTAQFNLNILRRINRELGADFKIECFEHHAVFNRELSRIEMHLASKKRQRVRICGESIEFRAGETIHTENSYKYTLESFAALARGSGWRIAATWTDAARLFSVHALTFENPAPKAPDLP